MTAETAMFALRRTLARQIVTLPLFSGPMKQEGHIRPTQALSGALLEEAHGTPVLA